jgi:hypothetical protein
MPGWREGVFGMSGALGIANEHIMELNAATEELLSNIAKDNRKQRPAKPVRIRYNGGWLVLPSGKTIWKRIGDAKSALRNFLGCYQIAYYDVDMRGYRLVKSKRFIGDYNEKKTCEEYVFAKMLESVEFVEVDGIF